MDRITVRLVARGRVQGVGYRWWARQQAHRLGLDGWVRNRLDGSVELLVAGPAAAVEQMAEACGRGPPPAAVSAVERLSAEGEEAPPGFQERRTL